MLSDTDLKQAEQILVQHIQTHYPDLDVRKGTAIRSFVIAPLATAYALKRKESLAVSATYRLEELDLQDESVVQSILENWFLAKSTGEIATGIVRIALSPEVTFFEVGPNSIFATETAIEFQTENNILRYSTETESDRRILVDEDSNLNFILVPVRAREFGTNGNIPAETILSSPSPGFSTKVLFIDAYVDFSGGSDPETTEKFRDRIRESISVRNFNSRKSITATVKNHFPSVHKVIPIGCGDSEMRRDIVFPTHVHTGGSVDIYISGSTSPSIQIDEFTIDSTMEVILQHTPVLKIRSVELLQGADRIPLTEGLDYEFINKPLDTNRSFLEARRLDQVTTRFSSNERIALTFKRGTAIPDLATVIGSHLIVTYYTDPSVLKVQEYVDEFNDGTLLASYLVKSLCPVFVNVTAKYYSKHEINEDQLRQELSDYIVNINPTEDLVTASKVIAIIEKYKVRRVELPVELEAEINLPTNNKEILFSTDQVSIPEQLETGFSSRICQYYCHPILNISLTRLI